MSLPDPGSSAYVVEVQYDHEAGLWFYEIDALNIIGTGCLSKKDAEGYAKEAILFVLEDQS